MKKKGKYLKIGDHVQFRFSGGHQYVRGYVMPAGLIKVYAVEDGGNYRCWSTTTNYDATGNYIILKE